MMRRSAGDWKLVKGESAGGEKCRNKHRTTVQTNGDAKEVDDAKAVDDTRLTWTGAGKTVIMKNDSVTRKEHRPDTTAAHKTNLEKEETVFDQGNLESDALSVAHISSRESQDLLRNSLTMRSLI